MSGIQIGGLGAVSPAGWGVHSVRAALATGTPVPCVPLPRPGQERPLRFRPVPPPNPRPSFLGHPRARRSAAIAHYVLGAALEAVQDSNAIRSGQGERLGLVVCVMSGCLSYSRRFFEEVLENPATASPLLFPETVFNAPTSHLAAMLGSTAETLTLVGDESAFVDGITTAAHWLTNGAVDACLVVGAEEKDWLIADAMRLFRRGRVHAAGAGALYLRRADSPSSGVELKEITDLHRFSTRAGRRQAARRMRAELPLGGKNELLVLGTQEIPEDADEDEAWRDWPGTRLAPRAVLGDGLPASAAWHCVAACDLLRRGEFDGATVSLVGANQHAVGVSFLNAHSPRVSMPGKRLPLRGDDQSVA